MKALCVSSVSSVALLAYMPPWARRSLCSCQRQLRGISQPASQLPWRWPLLSPEHKDPPRALKLRYRWILCVPVFLPR